MRQGRSFWETLTEIADMSSESQPGLPLVELVGERRALIENHQGVIAYSSDEIRVKVKFGQIVIYGECLVLSRMTGNQLLISGNIFTVQLCRRGNNGNMAFIKRDA